MQRMMFGVLAAAMTFTSAVVHADLITFPQPADSILNFDLTGGSPIPPFDSVTLTIPVTAGVVTVMYCEVFDGLDGTGLFVEGCAGIPLAPITYALDSNFPTHDKILDGIFSIKFNLNAGVTVTDPFAYGTKGQLRTAEVVGLVPAAHVPEPTTLVLLGLGLAGLGFVRRKK